MPSLLFDRLVWIRLVLMLVACMVVSAFAGVEAVPKFEVVTAFAKSPQHPGRGGLIEVSPGVFYGTTTSGGDYGCGAIYKMVSGVFTPVLHFTGKTGAAKGTRPIGKLLVDGTVLWGVTEVGGAENMGTVYKFDMATGDFTTVVEFGARSLTDSDYMGVQPRAGLVRDGNGMLWGVTSSVYGRVFKIDPAGGTAVSVVQLNGTGGVGAGVGVRGELVFDGVDSLWGVVSDPSLDYGKVYKIHQSTGAYMVAAAFTGDPGAVRGRYPTGSLVLDESGWLVGLCAPAVPGSGAGQVYKIEVSTGKYAVVGTVPLTQVLFGVQEGLVKSRLTGNYTGIGVAIPDSVYTGALFNFSLSNFNRPTVRGFGDRYHEGEGLVALTTTSAGEMAAAMSDGGRYGRGMVLRLSAFMIPSPLSNYSIGQQSDPDVLTGSQPAGGLAQDADGRLWGLARSGGDAGDGAIYSFLPHDDVVKKSLSFSITNASAGRYPVGELATTLSANYGTTLYGLTSEGGNSAANSLKYGSAFLLASYMGTPIGFNTYSGLTSASKNPLAGLAVAGDGSLWAASGNQIYTLKSSPAAQVVKATFTGTTGATPGSQPVGRLFMDNQGFMWGATTAGGPGNFGTLYKISTTPPYGFASVVQFTGKSGPNPGEDPTGALIADAAGMLWGTTQYGGAAGKGTVFKLDPVHGVLTTVVVFDNDSHSVRGQYPGAGLVADGRGYFWGTTVNGGANDWGTLFRIDAATGAFESMFDFTADTPSGSAPGSYPHSPLLLHSDGNLYGTTPSLSLDLNGMRKAGGNIFRLRFGRKLSVTSNMNSTITRSLSLLDGETSNFGGVFDVEASAKRTFTILNPGTTPITDFKVVVSGPQASEFKVTVPAPATINAGGKVTIEVVFDPSAAGNRSALLTLGGTSPDTDAFVIPLRGTGVLRKVSMVPTRYLEESRGAQAVAVSLSAPMSVPVKIPFKVTPDTATAADFSVSASPVIIPAGSITGVIWVTPRKDYLVEGQNYYDDESFGITLGQPLNSHVELQEGQETTTVHILDDDVEPGFIDGGGGIYAPGSVCPVNSGFQNPTALPFTGTWTHNGRIIPGATQPIYWIPSITSAQAGVYQYTVKTVTGLTLPSPPIQVWVLDQARVRSLAVPEGGTIYLSSQIAGDGFSFYWTRTTETATDQLLSDGERFSGTSTGTLRITQASLTDAGQYFCHLYDGSAEGVAFTLAVETIASRPATPEFPPAVVGKPYNYRLPRSGGSVTEPSLVVATGLPPGLVCDPGSGVITGRPTEKGRFRIDITMSNSHGGDFTSGYLEVGKLPDVFIGTYVGLANMGGYALNSFGARMDLTTNASGAVSGVYISGKTRRPFVSRLQLEEDGTAKCDAWLLGSNSTSLAGIHLEMSFDQQSHFTGHLSGVSDEIGDIYGWRNTWTATNHPASGVAGYHTFALVDDYNECGNGYGWLTVGVNGSTVVTGRLPDNSVFATSSFLAPDFWFMVYQPLYPELGGMCATAQLIPAAEPGGLDSIAEGAVITWSMPEKKAKTRYFQYGSADISGSYFTFVGGGYRKPKSGENLLNLPVVKAGSNNAQFAFHTYSDIATIPNVAFRMDPNHRATLPVPDSAANAPRVASVAFNAATGYFTGSLYLDYRTPLARSAGFKGVLVPGKGMGYGFFLLPMPANPAAAPPTTLATSRIVTCPVRMFAYPSEPGY